MLIINKYRQKKVKKKTLKGLSTQKNFGVDAQVVGRVEEASKKEMTIRLGKGTIIRF